MIAKIDGVSVLLSGDEATRIKKRSRDDLEHSLDAIKHWVEKMEEERESGSDNSPSRQSAHQFDLNVTQLLEKLYAYERFHRGYCHNDIIRNAFSTD